MQVTKNFPQSVIDAAWRRAQGRCECTENCHSVWTRCNKPLDPRNIMPGMRWHAHHINSEGDSVLSNCKILCVPCHKNTRSFGR